jgi:hypothetical protein
MDEDFKRLASTVDNCPFNVFVHGAGSNSDVFTVTFSAEKHVPWQGSSGILAQAHCTVLPELYGNIVMMTVSLRQTKKELGRLEPRYDEHNRTDQRWRYESFLMECAAEPLWNLLERSVDFERLTSKVAEEVMGS